MCLFSAVFGFLMLMSQTFNLALIFFALYFTLGDGWVAPVLSMLSTSAPANCKGQVMGYFTTIISIVGITMPLVVVGMFPQPTKPLNPADH